MTFNGFHFWVSERTKIHVSVDGIKRWKPIWTSFICLRSQFKIDICVLKMIFLIDRHWFMKISTIQNQDFWAFQECLSRVNGSLWCHLRRFSHCWCHLRQLTGYGRCRGNRIRRKCWNGSSCWRYCCCMSRYNHLSCRGYQKIFLKKWHNHQFRGRREQKNNIRYFVLKNFRFNTIF